MIAKEQFMASTANDGLLGMCDFLVVPVSRR